MDDSIFPSVWFQVQIQPAPKLANSVNSSKKRVLEKIITFSEKYALSVVREGCLT